MEVQLIHHQPHHLQIPIVMNTGFSSRKKNLVGLHNRSTEGTFKSEVRGLAPDSQVVYVFQVLHLLLYVIYCTGRYNLIMTKRTIIVYKPIAQLKILFFLFACIPINL